IFAPPGNSSWIPVCYNRPAPHRFKLSAPAAKSNQEDAKAMATELKRTSTSLDRFEELLGSEASNLLEHKSQTIPKEQLNLPGPDFIDRVWTHSDRSPAVLRSLQSLFDGGRLAGTGYLSILPVDQGIEHSAGASFATNQQYLDPVNIVKLDIVGD